MLHASLIHSLQLSQWHRKGAEFLSPVQLSTGVMYNSVRLLLGCSTSSPEITGSRLGLCAVGGLKTGCSTLKPDLPAPSRYS